MNIKKCIHFPFDKGIKKTKCLNPVNPAYNKITCKHIYI